MRVLLTRPTAQSQKLAQDLRDRGHDAVVSPVIEIEPCLNEKIAGSFEAVIATSGNAFRFLSGCEAARLKRLPLFVVGQTTAAMALARGFENLQLTVRNGQDLLAALTERLERSQRLLYLCGRDRKPGLENELRHAGYDLEVRVVYQAAAANALTDEAVAALHEQSIDAALHFSRRSAEIFARLVSAAGVVDGARAALNLCISRDAAGGLIALGPLRLAVAKTPDAAGILAALDGSGQ